MEFAIGVDGGGSGCRVRLLDRTGRVLAGATGGPSNIASNFAGALQNITAAVNAAGREAGVSKALPSEAVAVLGLAGANVGNHAQNLAAELGFARCRVVSDALISLDGALGGRDGTGAMIGTGSVFASRRHGEFRQLGGWGFQIGDQASGARIGRSVLEETLLAHDGIRAASELTRLMLERFDGAPGVTEFARQAAPADFAALAPLVLEAGAAQDEVALSVLHEAGGYVERAVNAVAFDASLPVTMIGGLSEGLSPYLPEQLRARLVAAQGNALDGAQRLALALLTGGGPHD